MLMAVTVPISVPSFNFTSHMDLFTTTTSISELPGVNLEAILELPDFNLVQVQGM